MLITKLILSFIAILLLIFFKQHLKKFNATQTKFSLDLSIYFQVIAIIQLYNHWVQ